MISRLCARTVNSGVGRQKGGSSILFLRIPRLHHEHFFRCFKRNVPSFSHVGKGLCDSFVRRNAHPFQDTIFR
jgi:hypothetical protein